MDNKQLQALIVEHLVDRLVRLGVHERELDRNFDLVRSGLLDSLGFIDLVAALEQATGRQVDLEKALESSDATTMNGIFELFN
jgi:acyl carrier protein